jgi:hypothetical protein
VLDHLLDTIQKLILVINVLMDAQDAFSIMMFVPLVKLDGTLTELDYNALELLWVLLQLFLLYQPYFLL